MATMGNLTRILSDSGRAEDIPVVWTAFETAKIAHRGQRRASGDRYITHPVEVATIVAHHGGTATAVCAALLHDVIEDTRVRSAELHAEFGREIATLVEELTAQAVRTAGPVDRDLGLVTVADRLHNLRTIRPLPPVSRQRVSLDTLVFVVPLARRVGVPVVAAELTDLACAALDSLECGATRERRLRLAAAARRMDPRSAAEAVAALGGSAALVSSGAVPEWALTAGGASVLVLMAVALFGRDPKAARRLAELLAAWRRD
jgi:(p)ppGpp synthase/HD superfamily hydrolase